MGPKNAFLYLRASSVKQDKSVAQQRKACQEFAKEQGISIIDEFVDDGVSAFKGTERPGFEKLLEACSSGRAGFVLLWSIDRFHRRYKEGMIELFTLEIAGVKIIDTMEGVYDSSDLGGILKQALGMFGAEQYSQKLSKNVARGHKDRREAGYPSGLPPLGYKLQPDSDNPKRNIWVPDPERQHIAQEMFECYDKGMTFQGIAARLNDLGWKPARAGYWNSRTVSQVLRNPIYGGMQGTVNRKDRTNVRKVKVVTFIEQDLWKRVYDAVDPTLVSRTNTPRRKNPLTGKVFCSKCGEPAHTVSGYKNIPRYRCRGYKSKVCTFSKTAYIGYLEIAILVQARACILQEGVEALTKRIIDEQYAKDKLAQESIQPLLDRLEELDREEATLLDIMVSGGDSPVLRRKRENLLREVEGLKEQIDTSDGSVRQIPYDEAFQRMVKELTDLRANLRPVLPHIDRITIEGPNLVRAHMFGWEIDMDLSKYDETDPLHSAFISGDGIVKKELMKN